MVTHDSVIGMDTGFGFLALNASGTRLRLLMASMVTRLLNDAIINGFIKMGHLGSPVPLHLPISQEAMHARVCT